MEDKKSILLPKLGGVVIKYLLFGVLSFLIRGLIQFGANELLGEGSFEDVTLEIFALILVILSFYSLTRTFLVHHSHYRKLFFEGNEPRLTFAKKARFIFTSPDFYLESMITYAMIAILPYRFGYTTLINTLSFLTPVSISMTKFYTILIMFPTVLLLNTVAYFSTLNHWIVNYQSDKRNDHENSFIKNLAMVVIIYLVVTPLFPASASVIITFANVLGNVATLIIIAVLLLATLATCYANAFLKRRKFIKRLRHICQGQGWELSKIKMGYLSLLRQTSGASFTLHQGDQSFACKLICGIRKSSPLFLDAAGNAKTVHTIRLGRFELFHYVHSFRFDFESDHKKIIVITPIPHKVFRSGGGANKEIDVGEKINEYQIYNATGFLNAIERNCVGK